MDGVALTSLRPKFKLRLKFLIPLNNAAIQNPSKKHQCSVVLLKARHGVPSANKRCSKQQDWPKIVVYKLSRQDLHQEGT